MLRAKFKNIALIYPFVFALTVLASGLVGLHPQEQGHQLQT